MVVIRSVLAGLMLRALLSLLIGIGAAMAQEQAAQEDRTLSIGYTQFAPFSMTSELGFAEGYSIDLYRALLNRSGYSASFVAFENPRAMLRALEDGRIDATSLLGITAERTALGQFTDVVRDMSIALITTSDGPLLTAQTPLETLRIGASDGSAPAAALARQGLAVMPFESSDDLLMPLLTGAVDAVAAIPEALVHVAREAGIENRLEVSEIVLDENPTALLVAPSRAVLVGVLNAGLDDLRRSGGLRTLEERWFGTARAEVPTGYLYVIAALCLALLAGGVAFALHYRAERASRIERLEEGDLLRNALNSVEALILIVDADMRVVWWNDTYALKRNWQKPYLGVGVDLEELIARSMLAGKTEVAEAHGTIRDQARRQVADIREGRDVVRTDVMRDDRVYVRRCSRLPTGEVAIIATDVTEMAARNAELRQTSNALKSANEKLSDFTRIAAHDLKAPLRHLRSLSSFIQDDVADMGVEFDADILHNFEQMTEVSNQLSRMIDELLVYSAPDRDFHPVPVDPVEEFRSAMSMLGVSASYALDLPEEMPEILVDSTAFRIVVRNLLSNAVKHHDKETGVIRVQGRVENGMCVIEVSDDGPGIPEKYRDVVFEPLKTLKPRSDGGGTGLGLSFVRRTLTSMGGDIIVVGRNAERGTTFRFRVPLSSPVAQIVALNERRSA